MRIRGRPAVLGLSLLLGACGGDGDAEAGPFAGTAAYCTSIRGTVATIPDPACMNCSFSNTANSVDGNLASATTVSMNQDASGTGPALRATAESARPEGTAAGAWVHIPQGAQAWSVTIKTLLGGTQQETRTIPSPSPVGSPGFDDYFSIATTLGFDAVQVQVADANFNPVPVDFLVYEICTDGGVQGQ